MPTLRRNVKRLTAALSDGSNHIDPIFALAALADKKKLCQHILVCLLIYQKVIVQEDVLPIILLVLTVNFVKHVVFLYFELKTKYLANLE